jgi:hypothetical protein
MREQYILSCSSFSFPVNTWPSSHNVHFLHLALMENSIYTVRYEMILLYIFHPTRYHWNHHPCFFSSLLHARTAGHIEGKDGERGGWRGEDREARMYVFEVKNIYCSL